MRGCLTGVSYGGAFTNVKLRIKKKISEATNKERDTTYSKDMGHEPDAREAKGLRENIHKSNVVD